MVLISLLLVRPSEAVYHWGSYILARRAEFLLLSTVDGEYYARAEEEVRRMGA